jgi:hypothetical protein
VPDDVISVHELVIVVEGWLSAVDPVRVRSSTSALYIIAHVAILWTKLAAIVSAAPVMVE